MYWTKNRVLTALLTERSVKSVNRTVSWAARAADEGRDCACVRRSRRSVRVQGWPEFNRASRNAGPCLSRLKRVLVASTRTDETERDYGNDMWIWRVCVKDDNVCKSGTKVPGNACYIPELCIRLARGSKGKFTSARRHENPRARPTPVNVIMVQPVSIITAEPRDPSDIFLHVCLVHLVILRTLRRLFWKEEDWKGSCCFVNRRVSG